MFAGTVIDDQVSDKFHTELMCLFDQGKAVLVRTVGWPDLFVVGNIVTHIILWRDPNGIGTKLFDVLQLGGNTLHITPTIVVGVFETCGINLIDCGLFPPLGFCFWMCRRNSHCMLLSFLYEKTFNYVCVFGLVNEIYILLQLIPRVKKSSLLIYVFYVPMDVLRMIENKKRTK
ncbi:Fsp2p [Saccharomyces cerevisiae Lalvin QA23]|nr:Fsp2p [Saccharomyces cerevisiae Lalvin QA23]